MKIIHKPQKDFHRNYLVEASSISEVVSEMIPRIREKSQAFYSTVIAQDLATKGETIIDQHAGNGCFYTIRLL